MKKVLRSILLVACLILSCSFTEVDQSYNDFIRCGNEIAKLQTMYYPAKEPDKTIIKTMINKYSSVDSILWNKNLRWKFVSRYVEKDSNIYKGIWFGYNSSNVCKELVIGEYDVETGLFSYALSTEVYFDI